MSLKGLRFMKHFVLAYLFGLVCVSGLVFSSNSVFADDYNAIDNVNIRVAISCNLSGTGMSSHNDTISNGIYRPNIGTTTLRAFCNDNQGFVIYAAGYTGDEVGGTNSNKLVGTPAGIGNIVTGTATTAGNPDISNWAMKLTAVSDSGDTTGTNAFTIDSDLEGSFANYHTVPNEYTKVAHKDSATGMGTSGGVSLTSTYAVYISNTQSSGSYSGKVIYTLLHPSTTPIPFGTLLDTGQVVSAKMKSLAANTEKAYNDKTTDIKAIRMADELPSGFTPSEANTVSDPNLSENPIYIFFDNTNDAGIMYFYSGGYQVVMNPDSARMFGYNLDLSDISGVANWDSSNVVNMQGMFYDDLSLTNVDALSRWDTSKVENLRTLLAMGSATITDTGYTPALTDVSGLANWDTSSVKNMAGLFQNDRSLASVRGIEFWDTSNVEDMSNLFYFNFSLTSVDVSHWDTHNVINMRSMFSVDEQNSSKSQLKEIYGLSEMDVSNVTDMTCMFYGVHDMKSYDIGGWDVGKVESFNHMFTDNYSLEYLDLSEWDVKSLKTVCNMFDDARSLKTIGDVSDWNTVSLIDMSGWLNGATSFVGDDGVLDLSGWDTSKVMCMTEVFRAVKLETIDLTGWDFSSVSNNTWEGSGEGIYYAAGNRSTYKGFSLMFRNTPNLTTVYVSQTGLNSYNTSRNNGTNATNMWTGSGTNTFTVSQ